MDLQVISRRDYFAVQFATKLMQVKFVNAAPGKVAVPRNQGMPTMQVNCEMGIAVRMADDLGRILDTQEEPPAPLTVHEPEPTPETPNENPPEKPEQGAPENAPGPQEEPANPGSEPSKEGPRPAA